jgi:peptidoglycan/LPS O-acetylase OafA/YrhL
MTGRTAQQEQAYFGALDGLRALSVLAVVWHHARPTGLESPLASRGFLGVDVFFVISGFLITHLLMREEARTGRVQLGKFWVRRALRLWPLWFAILIALSALFAFVLPNAPMASAFWRDLPWNATYTSNLIVPGTFLAISWSLALEEQFYLVWPLVWSKLRAGAVPMLVFLGGLSVGIHLGLFEAQFLEWFGPHGSQTVAVKATVLPLVLGCALALAPQWTAKLAKPALAPLWLAALLGLASLGESVTDGQVRLGAQWMSAGLVASCVGAKGPKWLTLPPLRWIGERAYGVYLLHIFCVQLLPIAGSRALPLGEAWAKGERGLGAFAFVLATSLVAAFLSYRLLEQPFLKLKARFR